MIEDCDLVIKWIEEGEWEESRIGNEAENRGIRTSKSRFFEMLSWTNPDFIHDMNKKVWNEINKYAISWDFTFFGIESPSVQKYAVGKEYKVHTDHYPQSPRICSAVLYLNDNFSGGHTFFPYVNYSVEPKAGRLAIFPSNFIYAHAALPVEKGTKYAVAYWANG